MYLLWLKSLLQHFSIYPQYCLSCHQSLGLLCELCELELKLQMKNQCLRCGFFYDQSCRCSQHQLNHQQSIAIFPYHHPLSQCLVKAKYSEAKDFSDYQSLLPLAILHFQKSLANGIQRHSPLQASLSDIDVLCPIPSQKKRLVQRGYSAPYLFAKALAQSKCFPKASLKLLLKTTRDEAQQATKSAADRWQLDGLFALNRGLKHLEKQAMPKGIKSFKILMIDDVCTTGSTFDHAAQCFIDHGVKPENIFSLSLFGGHD
jgi:predicted amidophosphoribosyltransferase